MRILLLTPIETPMLAGALGVDPAAIGPGHGGTVTADLAVALAADGHEVTAVTLDATIDAVQEVRGDNLRYIGVPMRPDGRAQDLYREERRALQQVADEVPADVVNAHWTYEYAMVGLRSGRPTVVTVHDWAPAVLRHQPSPYWVAKSLMAARVYAARPPMTSPGPALLDQVRRVRRDARLTPNGIPAALVDDSTRAGPGDRPVVLSVANGFTTRKNTQLLLQAWPDLRRRVPGVRLRLLGNDHGPGEAAATWAAARGLAEGVEFVGGVERDQVLQEMGEAAVLAHPARTEPFGMVVLEAMARGTPVVAARGSGGPPYILADGVHGELVDPADASGLADAVASLCTDAERWVRASADVRQRVTDRFVIQASARTYGEVYDDLLAGRWGS